MDFKYLKNWKQKAYERTGGRGKGLALFFDVPTKENNKIVDMHYHDQSSDGSRGIEQMFNEASNNGLSLISATNHDNITTQSKYYGYEVSHGRYKGEILNGVEITARLNGQPVEVLVYDYDYKKAKNLIDNLEFPYLNRSFRIQRILALCKDRLDIVNELNITDKKLSINDFVSIEAKNEKGETQYVPFSKVGLDAYKDIGVGTKRFTDWVSVEGKTYQVNFDYFNAKMFKYIAQSEKGREFLKNHDIQVKEDFVSQINIQSLEMPELLKPEFAKFNRGIIQAKNAPLAVSDEAWWPTVEQISKFAQKAGGVALLAHPYGYSSVKVKPEQLMKEAVAAGVDGIECLHGFNSASQVEEIYNFCRKNNLLISAGSDTHDFYSNQGNKTEIGVAPGVGEIVEDEPNPIHEMKISLYNLHYIGSGEYKKEFMREPGE